MVMRSEFVPPIRTCAVCDVFVLTDNISRIIVFADASSNRKADHYQHRKQKGSSSGCNIIECETDAGHSHFTIAAT